MRAESLRLDDLLEIDPEGGVFRFAGQRTLLLDAVALGLLRAQLVRTVGERGARAMLTQLGYAHGWRSAKAIRHVIPWDDEREWRIAGGRLHRLQGMVRFEPVEPGQQGKSRAFADAIWKDSYEAEQHLTHLGQAEQPICWSLCGFASGYLSAATGEEIYCIEEACVGCGDAVCRMVGRHRTDWGDAIEPHLPFYERDCLEAALQSVRDDLRQVESKLRAKRRLLGPEYQLIQDGMVVRSKQIEAVVQVATRAAGVDTNVLILGETGVGKERLARLIHQRSTRAAGPFIAINCGAIPESLLEGELFGYAKGAFSGAVQHRAGLFEAANGGTLFLDEIAEVSPQLQVRLLRVLQERQVRRLGENRDRPIDVRLLAATHRDLRAAVGQGTFREDLLYRLRVVEIVIPPLRERPDDILPLARVHLTATAKRFKRDVRDFTPQVARRLLAHPWPGNVRELHNAIERAVVFADGDCLRIEDLPDELRGAGAPAEDDVAQQSAHAGSSVPLSGTLEQVERALILQTLERTSGNKAAAARQLGIGVATLFRKLKKYSTYVAD
jgi:two-component system response regulator HydG